MVLAEPMGSNPLLGSNLQGPKVQGHAGFSTESPAQCKVEDGQCDPQQARVLPCTASPRRWSWPSLSPPLVLHHSVNHYHELLSCKEDQFHTALANSQPELRCCDVGPRPL